MAGRDQIRRLGEIIWRVDLFGATAHPSLSFLAHPALAYYSVILPPHSIYQNDAFRAILVTPLLRKTKGKTEQKKKEVSLFSFLRVPLSVPHPHLLSLSFFLSRLRVPLYFSEGSKKEKMKWRSS